MKTTQPTKPRKSNAGRKWFDGKDEKAVIAKLEYTAAMDATVNEMLFYADISPDSYYRYLKAHPDFARQIERLKQSSVLEARQTVKNKIQESYSNAMDYLSRKRKNEFSTKQEIDHGMSEEVKELTDFLRGKLNDTSTDSQIIPQRPESTIEFNNGTTGDIQPDSISQAQEIAPDGSHEIREELDGGSGGSSAGSDFCGEVGNSGAERSKGEDNHGVLDPAHL